MKVDLSKCKPGDWLKMRNGEVCEYICTQEKDIYGRAHLIRYSDGGNGGRFDNGLALSPLDSGIDIIAILPRRKPISKPRRSLAEVLFRALHDERGKDTLFTDLDEYELIDYARAARAVAREVRRRAAK